MLTVILTHIFALLIQASTMETSPEIDVVNNSITSDLIATPLSVTEQQNVNKDIGTSSKFKSLCVLF